MKRLTLIVEAVNEGAILDAVSQYGDLSSIPTTPGMLDGGEVIDAVRYTWHWETIADDQGKQERLDGVSVSVESSKRDKNDERSALVEILAVLDRLESSGESFDLDMIRVHVPEQLREKLAADVAGLNTELRAQGY